MKKYHGKSEIENALIHLYELDLITVTYDENLQPNFFITNEQRARLKTLKNFFIKLNSKLNV